MTIIPANRSDQIEFFKDHVELWDQQPEAVGLSQQTVDEVRALTDAAAQRKQIALAARTWAESMTTLYHDAVRAMRGSGGRAVQHIKVFAEDAPSPGDVYAAAGLPLPATPVGAGVVPAPPLKRLTAQITTDGFVDLTWRFGGSPISRRGAYVRIERRETLPGDAAGPWMFAATSATRRWRDRTLPPGLAQVEYRVRAYRGERVADPRTTTIALGAQPLKISPAVARAA